MDSLIHDFQERLGYSMTLSDEGDWVAFYKRIWPEAISIVRLDAASRWQRAGVDRMIILPDRKTILIDEKKREKDYGDILLEKWSVFYKDGDRGNKPGWAVDQAKVCDYIVYAVPVARKAYLLPFELLRAACVFCGPKWDAIPKFVPPPALNRGYVTVNWAIPWAELSRALAQQMHRKMDGGFISLPAPKVNGEQIQFDLPGLASPTRAA